MAREEVRLNFAVGAVVGIIDAGQGALVCAIVAAPVLTLKKKSFEEANCVVGLG